MLCLTMFPIIGLGEPYIPRFGGVLQECGYFTWRVSDCDDYRELSEDDSYPKLSQRNSGVYDTASFLFFSYRPPGKSEG